MMVNSTMIRWTAYLLLLAQSDGLNYRRFFCQKTRQAHPIFSLVDESVTPTDPGSNLKVRLESFLWTSAGALLAVAGASVARPRSASAIDAGLAQPASTGATASAASVPDAVVELGPAPSDFGLVENDYYGDAAKVVRHMRYACQMSKGNPDLQQVARQTKQEMVDFVSFYRRFQGVQGKPSFSLLYTSINVLAGHYASYGLKVAVPEKRRRRLLQELADIEKNIRRQR